MSLFFPSKKPSVPPTSSHPTPHASGHITKRELERDVMGRLRRAGLNEEERAAVGAVASGHMDHQGFMSSGMDAGEKDKLMEELHEVAPKLHIENEDLPKIDDALNRSM